METAGLALRVNGLGDIGWLEDSLRKCSNQACLQILLGLLQTPGIRIPGDEPREGERKVAGVDRTLHTIFGAGPIQRNWFKSPEGEGRFPLDEALGLIDGHTPRLAGLIARGAASAPFEQAASDFNACTGLDINGRQFQRIAQRVGREVEGFLRADHGRGKESAPRVYVQADGTGAPLRKDELRGRKGRGADGKAKTHEVKVAAIFTAHPVPGEEPWRDLDTTTYVATDQRCEDFGEMVRAEYLRRFDHAEETIFISDGAAWVGNLGTKNFANVIRIVDWYHAAEHVSSMAELVHPKHTAEWQKLRKGWVGKLWNGKVESLVRAAGQLFPDNRKEEGEKAVAYFTTRKEYMDYAVYRAKGYFIGSGVVEAACKTVVGQRFKGSGMHWSQKGMKNLLAIRTTILSNRYKEFWTWRERQKLAA